MVQVLPYVPSFSEELTPHITQTFQNIAQGIQTRRQREKDALIFQQLNDPNLTPVQKIQAGSKLSPESQKFAQATLPRVLQQQEKTLQQRGEAERIIPGISGGGQQPMGRSNQSSSGNSNIQPSKGLDFSKIHTNQLTPLAGVGGVYGDQATQELNRRKAQEGITEKVRTESAQRLAALPEQKANLRIARQSVQSEEGGLTGNYLADLTGFPGFRNVSGAALNTASKNYLIGTLNKVAGSGARPNQFLEQQVAKGFPIMGQPKLANLASIEVAESTLDMEEKYLQNLDDLSNKYRNEFGFVPETVISEAQKMTAPYAQEREYQAAYNIQRLSEQSKGIKELEKNKQVPKGTPLTAEKEKILRDKYKHTDDLAEQQEKVDTLAKQLGYEVPSEEFRQKVGSEPSYLPRADFKSLDQISSEKSPNKGDKARNKKTGETFIWTGEKWEKSK